MTHEQLHWLLIEGLTPLFGAGLIYTFLGAVQWLASADKTNFKYSWKEALDTMGWLYGGLIIAIQATLRCTNSKVSEPLLVTASVIGAVVCFVMLLTAMGKRGQEQEWYPPNSMKIVSIIVAIAILGVGFRARALTQQTDSALEQVATPVTPGGHK